MMKNNASRFSAAAVVVAILILAAFLALPTQVAAKSKVVAIEGTSYNVNSSLEDNLKSLVGKKVLVSCVSGKTYSGFVKKVGNHLIHLEKLQGQEYFDALIRIDNISAVEAQFRKIQR